MPAASRLRSAEVLECCFFLLPGHVCRLARIEADKNNLVVGTGIEREHLQRADDALFDLVAEHRAAVIDESENYWLAVEVVAESDVAAGLIFEMEGQRNLPVERRFEANVAQGNGEASGRRARVAGYSLRRNTRAAGEHQS